MTSFISDVDECTLFRDICGNGVCRNREGSYECICQEGYELTRARDTCMGKVYDSNPIHKAAQYTQTCPNKYQNICTYCSFVGFCLDINECTSVRGICAGGRCRNLEGGYRCECPPGLLLTSDGQKCIGKIRNVL